MPGDAISCPGMLYPVQACGIMPRHDVSTGYKNISSLHICISLFFNALGTVVPKTAQTSVAQFLLRTLYLFL